MWRDQDEDIYPLEDLHATADIIPSLLQRKYCCGAPHRLSNYNQTLEVILRPIVDSTKSIAVIANVAGGLFQAGYAASFIEAMNPEISVTMLFAQYSPYKAEDRNIHMFASEQGKLTSLHDKHPTSILMVDHLSNAGNSIHAFLNHTAFEPFPTYCLIEQTDWRIELQSNTLKSLSFDPESRIGLFGRNG